MFFQDKLEKIKEDTYDLKFQFLILQFKIRNKLLFY